MYDGAGSCGTFYSCPTHIIAGILIVACQTTDPAPPTISKSSEPVVEEGAATEAPQAALMEQGLQLMDTAPLDAVARFDEVLALNPEHYGAHYQRAQALDRAKKIDAALLAWAEVNRRATAIDDTETIVMARARVDVLAEIRDRSSVAMERGMALLQTGATEAALQQFDTVLRDHPVHYGALYQRAAALEQLGQREAAIAAWKRFLALNPSPQDAHIATSRVAILQNAASGNP